MEEQNIRMAIDRHWAASAAGDQVAEHEIYHDDIVCEYPQSGEVIRGRSNLQALRSQHPGRPSGFSVRRIVGKGNLWITEYVIIYEGKRVYTVSIMEFRDGKVSHEIQYFADPFNAPAWRAQWVRNGGGRQHLSMRCSELRKLSESLILVSLDVCRTWESMQDNGGNIVVVIAPLYSRFSLVFQRRQYWRSRGSLDRTMRLQL